MRGDNTRKACWLVVIQAIYSRFFSIWEDATATLRRMFMKPKSNGTVIAFACDLERRLTTFATSRYFARLPIYSATDPGQERGSSERGGKRISFETGRVLFSGSDPLENGEQNGISRTWRRSNQQSYVQRRSTLRDSWKHD